MKKTIRKMLTALPAALLAAVLLSACGAKNMETVPETVPETTASEPAAAQESVETEAEETAAALEEIHIIYTNDVHGSIYNQITDKENNTKPGLRFSNVAAMKQDLKNEGKNVLLLDAGDEIQGSIYGNCDKGESIIRLMNMVGYDAATLGNHEFDYSMEVLFDRTGEAKYPFLSCNFWSVKDGEEVFAPSEIFDFNGTKVAVVGITTPATLSDTSPKKFQDENGEFIYTVKGLDDPELLYETVQKAVDAVRGEADYVIALGHLGVGREAVNRKISSVDVIANTEGIDALIDGHSHTMIECEHYKNRKGEDVVLTQTGVNLQTIGSMTISPDGTITTELISEYENADPAVRAGEDAFHAQLDEQMGQKIAQLGSRQYINLNGDPKKRIIRAMETNLGDLVTDAYYWYINDVAGIPCEVVLENGGGIRAGLEKGAVSVLDIRNVCPFGNQICVIEVTGQELIDILENGATETGKWNEEWDCPAENSSFMHAAGMRYTIDASIPCTVKLGENNRFEGVDGAYRVKDAEIYNRTSGAYEPVDPEATYRLGGFDFMLRNGGCGLGFLSDNTVIADYLGPDAELFTEYLLNFGKDGDMPLIITENSPLAGLRNYMINYEEPMGAGRISRVNLPYDK